MIDLKEFRKANKISQTALADYLGIGQGFVSQMENGERPMPISIEEKIRNNDRGWVISDFADIDTPLDSLPDDVDYLKREVIYLQKRIAELTEEKAAYWRLIERVTGPKC